MIHVPGASGTGLPMIAPGERRMTQVTLAARSVEDRVEFVLTPSAHG